MVLSLDAHWNFIDCSKLPYPPISKIPCNRTYPTCISTQDEHRPRVGDIHRRYRQVNQPSGDIGLRNKVVRKGRKRGKRKDD